MIINFSSLGGSSWLMYFYVHRLHLALFMSWRSSPRKHSQAKVAGHYFYNSHRCLSLFDNVWSWPFSLTIWSLLPLLIYRNMLVLTNIAIYTSLHDINKTCLLRYDRHNIALHRGHGCCLIMLSFSNHGVLNRQLPWLYDNSCSLSCRLIGCEYGIHWVVPYVTLQTSQ